MIDRDLDTLNAKEPDHGLGALESDVWARVAAREQSRVISRTVLASQALILALALAGSVMTGYHRGAFSPPSDLGVFSPHTPMAASTLLAGDPE
jgi:hypothetical protein